MIRAVGPTATSPQNRALRSVKPDSGYHDAMWKTLILTAGLTFTLVASSFAKGGITDEQRKTIEQTLGPKLLGDAVNAPTLDDPADWFPLKPARWEYRLTSGEKSGSGTDVELDRLQKSNHDNNWRLAVGTDHVQFLTVDDKGLFRVSGQNHKQGVLTRYQPAQPILLAGLKPGEQHQLKIGVKVYDLSDPSDLEHTGSLEMTLTYVGAYRITVPAGTFDAVFTHTVLAGKVGPASVHDEQYIFFAKGVGIVASIEQEDISALFLYHQDSKVGKVLVSRDEK